MYKAKVRDCSGTGKDKGVYGYAIHAACYIVAIPYNYMMQKYLNAPIGIFQYISSFSWGRWETETQTRVLYTSNYMRAAKGKAVRHHVELPGIHRTYTRLTEGALD